MKRDRLLPLVIWLLLGLLIAGLSGWHPTHATSPDSAHYLRMASDWRTYDGTFPPGYSGLIWLVSTLTNLPGLWASKLVNWLALGHFGWAWTNRIGAKRAVWLLGIWLLPGNLRVATYTWSETVFIVLLLEVVWRLYRLQVEQSRKNALWVAGVLAALFWVRYVGLFLYIGVAHRTMVLRQAVRPIGLLHGFLTPLYILGIAPLLLLNLFLTDYLFGGPRLLPTETWPELLRMMGVAVLNEVLLYDYQANTNLSLFIPALLVQLLGVVMAVWWLRHKGGWQRVSFAQNPLVRCLFSVGLTYFLTLFILRTISPFDPLTERLMTPGSICWLVALVMVMSVQSQHSIINKSPERAETFTNPSSAASLLLPER